MNKKKENLITSEHRSKGLSGLSQTLSPLIKNLLGAKGLAEGDLLANWQNIVGAEMAEYSLPQKIEFKKNTKLGGILSLITPNGAFALEIQHKEPLIIEKINAFFGYQIVAKIKILQNNTSFNLQSSPKCDDKAEKKLVTQEEQNYISKVTAEIKNPELKERLEKLGLSIFMNNK